MPSRCGVSVVLQVLDDFDVLSGVRGGAAVVAPLLQVLEFVLEHLALPLLVRGQSETPGAQSGYSGQSETTGPGVCPGASCLASPCPWPV